MNREKIINSSLIAIIVLLVLSAGFFIMSSKKKTTSTDGPGFILEEAKKATGSVKIGTNPPSFTLTDLATLKTINLDTLKGKTVFIEFGSTLCGICAFDMKNLDKFITTNKELLADGYESKLEVLWVNIDPTETKEEILRYSRSYDNAKDWKWTRDTNQVAIRYGAPFTGTTYILDKNGKVSYKDGANTYYEDIVEQITKAMAVKLEGVAT